MLKTKLGINNPGHEIAKCCYDELGWRRKEDDSLIRIVKFLSPTILENSGVDTLKVIADLTLDLSDHDLFEQNCSQLARRIYKIRNQLVHQVEIQTRIELDSEDWKGLLKFFIILINESFSKFAADLP